MWGYCLTQSTSAVFIMTGNDPRVSQNRRELVGEGGYCEALSANEANCCFEPRNLLIVSL